MSFGVELAAPVSALLLLLLHWVLLSNSGGRPLPVWLLVVIGVSLLTSFGAQISSTDSASSSACPSGLHDGISALSSRPRPSSRLLSFLPKLPFLMGVVTTRLTASKRLDIL
jgi:hypothetical protein